VNALARRIAERIRREGPLSIAAFMALALHDPEHGYYACRDPLGRAGDFITAPEISQIFGELIGLWFAEIWRQLGQPDPVILAELGPGRGTLMTDFYRAASSVPGFRRALRLYLVEASPRLQAVQRQSLAAAEPRFVDSLDGLPDGPLLLVGNEFLDALPIRQLVRRSKHWAERLVIVDAAGRLGFADGPETAALDFLLPAKLRDEPVGTIIELCPTAAALTAALGARLATQPGAALFVDYGYFPSKTGATLAAISGHQPAAVLEAPGEADLSAHVDFAAIAAAARASGAALYGPVTQRRFLRILGAEARLAALLSRASPGQSAALKSGLDRLIDPEQMGTLFKALAVLSPGLPTPAGFE